MSFEEYILLTPSIKLNFCPDPPWTLIPSGLLITIKSSSSKIIIQLNDHLVDMDEEITVNYLDKKLFKGFVHREIDVIKQSILEYGDPKSVFYGKIHLTLDS